MENRKRRAVRTLVLVGMAVCLMPVGRAYCQSARHRAQRDSLKAMITAQTPAGSTPKKTGTPGEADLPKGTGVPEEEGLPKGTGGPGEADLPDEVGTPQEVAASVPAAQNGPGVGTGSGQTGEKPCILEQYAALYEENNDFAGWLSIEGMKIDYPVMQCADDKYYLHRDFYGEESRYGSLYVKARADLDAGTNVIIYGHNMKDGSMFGDLDLYLKESFYKKHSMISFDTRYEKRYYEIIAVFRSQVYNTDDDVFKYYQFYEADTQEEFDRFYENIKALSLYDTGVEAQFGDTFLTLSTCAYHVPDGRFVVVAKRVE